MDKAELLCIAHRGAMGHEPENTLGSVRKALEMGVLCIEIDVYFVDGHLLVFHDDRLERTTNGSGYLCEQRFEYLRSLDAGGGQQIPTLEEVCETVDSAACINIELKGSRTAEPVANLLNRLVDKGWDSKLFLVSSFYHRELQVIKKLLPAVKLGVLIKGRPAGDCRFAEDIGAFSVNPSLDFVDSLFLDDAHARGLKVFVYTVDNSDDISRMAKLGADGVFTGYPEKVLDFYTQPDAEEYWR